jgi:nucleoside-diphosphate-sugar epimerase
MEGSTVDSSVLTSTAIADAVWAALASQNNDSGTMGEQLNNAGSGGIDIGALADAIADAVLSDPALLTVGKFLGLK